LWFVDQSSQSRANFYIQQGQKRRFFTRILCHNPVMPVRTTIELPQPLHERLKQRSEASGASIRSLIVQAVQEAYAETVSAPKTGRRVTLPLITATGKRGPRFPVDENPHDLVFS